MIDQQKHIISRLGWNTTFDQKEGGVQLQNRLSNWSRIKMPAEITRLFDDMCPSDQFWKIDSLEIDLGQIDLDSLEADLSLKLNAHLREKLMDMMRYENAVDVSITVLDKKGSVLDMIVGFLLNGVMPWSYTAAYGTINQMLGLQFQHNKKDITEALSGLGKNSFNVRKRIAWQFSESNIIRFIEGLEPNYHEEVIGFSNELKEIQTQQPFVPGSINDFSKNIWLWVINFLLTDRGTTFNKITFMKSSIHQMAAHYNISHQDLFQILRKAATKISHQFKISTDFMLILNAVSNQYEVESLNTALQYETEYWIKLKENLQNKNQKITAVERKEFNGLVLSLFAQNAEKFKALLLETLKQDALLAHIALELNEPSTEAIYTALLGKSAQILVDSIHLLCDLSHHLGKKADLQWYRRLALKFLIKNQGTSYNNHSFLSYCIKETSTRFQLEPKEVLKKMLRLKSASGLKTTTNLQIYGSLNALYKEILWAKDDALKNAEFRQLIMKIIALHKLQEDREELLSLQKALIKQIQLDPKSALLALIAFEDKKELENCISGLLGTSLLSALIKHVEKPVYLVFTSVSSFLDQTTTHSASLISGIKRLLLPSIIHLVVFEPAQNLDRLFENSLLRFYHNLSSIEQREFGNLVSDLILIPVVNASISDTLKNKLRKKYGQLEIQSPLAQVELLISSSERHVETVGMLIKAHFADDSLIQVRQANGKQGNAILDYLIKDGSALLTAFLVESTAVFVQNLNRRLSVKEELFLKELFWKCISDYNSHRGRVQTLKESLKLAFYYHFSPDVKQLIGKLKKGGILSISDPGSSNAEKKKNILDFEQNHNQKLQAKAPSFYKAVKLASGKTISVEQLHLLIEQCLNGQQLINKHLGFPIELSELLTKAMELETEVFLAVLSRVHFTKNSKVLFKSILKWSDLNIYLRHHSNGVFNQAHEALSLMYEWLALKTDLAFAQDFLEEAWEITFILAEEKPFDIGLFKRLMAAFFMAVSKQGHVTSTSLFLEMRKNRFSINPLLKQALVKYGSGFSELPLAELVPVANQKLMVAVNKGLLNDLLLELILKQQIPLWYANHSETDLKLLLKEIIAHYPLHFLQIFKNKEWSHTQMSWMSQFLDLPALVRSIGKIDYAQRPLLQTLGKLYTALGRIGFKEITSAEVQELLFLKILKCWRSNNWKMIATDHIWNELLWDLKIKRAYSIKAFLSAIESAKMLLPLSLQVSFRQLKDQYETKPVQKDKPVQPIAGVGAKVNLSKQLKQGIEIRNAGLVLLSGYVQRLLNYLSIELPAYQVRQKDLDVVLKARAVHYLQYMVTGQSATDESLLMLNKVMCGLPIHEPIPNSIEISEKEKTLINGLIEAVIGYWPSLGKSSVDGFRGNWLVRDGLLFEHEDKWELTVKNQPYDVLIDKSNLSYSIIKYIWMDKPLHVNWPY